MTAPNPNRTLAGIRNASADSSRRLRVDEQHRVIALDEAVARGRLDANVGRESRVHACLDPRRAQGDVEVGVLKTVVAGLAYDGLVRLRLYEVWMKLGA